jgi:hypothetical protein
VTEPSSIDIAAEKLRQQWGQSEAVEAETESSRGIKRGDIVDAVVCDWNSAGMSGFASVLAYHERRVSLYVKAKNVVMLGELKLEAKIRCRVAAPAVDYTSMQGEQIGEALDWFDRSAEAMQLRNQPAPPPRKLSEQAQIDAGIKPVRLKGHEADKPMVSMQEAAQKARELFEKQHGLPSEEQLYKNKAEALSVTNRQGKFDHAKTSELRQIFARNNANGSVNWKVIFALRNKAADKIEKEKNR